MEHTTQYKQVVELIGSTGHISNALIRRELGVGWYTASRILKKLETEGHIIVSHSRAGRIYLVNVA